MPFLCGLSRTGICHFRLGHRFSFSRSARIGACFRSDIDSRRGSENALASCGQRAGFASAYVPCSVGILWPFLGIAASKSMSTETILRTY